MIKKILFFSSIICSLNCFAQKSEISFKDAILEQNRKFKADKMNGWVWYPKSNKYTFLSDNGKELLQADAKENKPTTFLKIEDINSALKTSFSTLNGYQWKNENTLFISKESKYYEYNVVNKVGKLVQQNAPENENQTFDKSLEQLAFTIENNLYFYDKNQKKIAITSNADKNIVSGQAIARSEFGITNGIFWSPKSSFIAFYQKDETEVANYPLLDINETPGKLVSIKYPMAGQQSEKAKVGIYHIASNKTVFISPQGSPEDYLTNLSWTPDEQFVLIAEINRAQNEMHLNLYEAISGKFVRTLFTESNSKWVEPEHAAFFPNLSSTNFVWITEKEGYNNLYYYDLNGKLLQKLTNNPFPVKDIIGTNDNGSEIYFTATGENALNTLAYKVDLKANQTLLTKEEGVHYLKPNATGKYFLDEYSNAKTPNKSVVINPKLEEHIVLESKNKYEGYTIGTSEIITIKAGDGSTNLYARLIKPSHFDANKKYPVLVYVYGGPHAQMITNSFLNGANLWMYWLAEQGYLVFTVDNRGSSYRGFEFESVIHRNLGVKEIEDQMMGVAYLKTLPFVDANRLAVHGWSFGGFMTTSLMLRKADTFKVGVAGGPVIDWKWYEIMYGERYMDTPQENKNGYEEASTLNYAKNLKGKLLLIHGTNDDVVVMQHNLAMLQEFIKQEKQVDFFPYPMHKHNVFGKDKVHLMKKILDYIIENNK